MDKFQYTIKMKKIDQLKTLKSKDAMIRELVKEIKYSPKDEDVDSNGYLYQCVTKLLLVYNHERLPDNINRTITDTGYRLIERYCNLNRSYKQFIDTFQFLEEVTIAGGNRELITQLVEIFQDNTIPFKFKYTAFSDEKYVNVLNDVEDELTTFENNVTRYYGQSAASLILQVEELKRSLPSNITYSIIEDMLDQLYSSFKHEANTLETLTTMANNTVTQMEHLVTVSNTFRERLLRT